MEKLMKEKIKILLSYHKKDILFKDNILTPIHAGREIAVKTKDQNDENLVWLLENTMGDNTGDNISTKNPLYNEMTTVYWAWKNYSDLGNPDYIGFMHYRRHFIFKEMEKPVYDCIEADEEYYNKINYSEETLQEIMAGCDFVCAAPYYRNTVYDHYKKNHDIADLDGVVDIINEKYPEFSADTQKYLRGNQAYFCNMFIFSKEIFFEYCSWLFDITFELEKRRDMSGKRLFVSEWLTGIFITRLQTRGKKGRFFATMIIEGEHTIPLVFAADNNYAIPMYVAMASAFASAKPNTIYDVHLLLSGDFSPENIERLETIKETYPRHQITTYNMKNQYDDVEMKIEHITAATYYRLKLPSLLSNINKCIYLDVDLIVNQDLSELFRINIDDKYIAGVRAAGYYWPEHHVKNRLEKLEIPSIDQYVNAGVLMMNLAKMRKNNLENGFEQLIKNQYQSQDQDILNKACYGMIRIIPPKYNAMVKYHLLDDNAYKESKALQLSYALKEWNQGRNNPVIIHYADRIKPWDDIGVEYADRWWDIASKLPFFKDIFEKYSISLYSNARRNGDLQYALYKKEKECKELAKKLKIERKKLKAIKSTPTFQIGAAIVYIPRKIKGGLKCIKQHGVVYTAKLTVKKILK